MAPSTPEIPFGNIESDIVQNRHDQVLSVIGFIKILNFNNGVILFLP